jgi:integrase
VLFYQATRRAKLPQIPLHSLRHSFATTALAAGENPKVVSERLGHAGVSITLDVYAHVTPAMSKESAARAARLILGDS